MLAEWRNIFDELKQASAATPKVGRMKLKPGEQRYAVALRDGSDLWLTLWVRRSPKGEIFIMLPRGNRAWDPHNSYHRDGTFHAKSFGRKFGPPQSVSRLTAISKAQSIWACTQGTGRWRGVRSGSLYRIVEVEPGILGPRDGVVTPCRARGIRRGRPRIHAVRQVNQIARYCVTVKVVVMP